MIASASLPCVVTSQVYDGSKTGFDLNFLSGVTKVSANWQGFGVQSAVSSVSGEDVSAGQCPLGGFSVGTGVWGV